MNYETLKNAINTNVYENDSQLITGEGLNGVLISIKDSLKAGYLFGGIATPNGAFIAGDERMVFLALEAGTYTAYGNFELDGETAHLLSYDTEWHDTDLHIPTEAVIATINAALAEKADSEDVNDALALKANTSDVEAAIAEIVESKFYYINVDGMIKGNNTFTYANNSTSMVIQLVPGSEVRLTANADLNADFAFLKTFNADFQEGGTPDFSAATGYTSRIRLTKGTTDIIVCPQDSNYLFINKIVSGETIMPSSISINGLNLSDSILTNLLKVQQSEHSVENAIVEDYLNSVQYDDSDYSYSEITDYTAVTTGFRKDQPKPIVLDLTDYAGISKLKIGDNENLSYTFSSGLSGETFYIDNLIPKKEYYIKAMNASDVVIGSKKIIPSGSIRMIKCDSLINIRDIGGWKAFGGKHIKYGLIIRGSALNEGSYIVSETDKDILVNFAGIRSEFDLSTNQGSSPLGDSVEYNSIDPPRWQEYNESPGTARRDALAMIRLLITTLTNDKPVYIHCLGGADRTGSCIMTIEAILGMSENNMIQDYELTSFSTYGLRARNLGYPPSQAEYDYPAYALPSIKSYPGKNLSEQWINYLKDSTDLPSGISPLSDDEVDALRDLMLE